MVWWYTKMRHDWSTNGFVRRWLGGSLLDRFIMVTLPGVVWLFVWGWVGIMSAFASKSAGPFAFFFFIGLFPWLFVGLDWLADLFHPRADLAPYTQRDDVIMGTRCEYVGGHPLLPQGRFAYLLLEGTRENPNLTVGFPARAGATLSYFPMPLLDLAGAMPNASQGDSVGGEVIGNMLAEMNLSTSIKDGAARFLRSEKLSLIVEYRGDGGGSYKVELANFLSGNEEIRNWQNYLVCARAEALTGQRPFGPWKSLASEPPAELQEAAGAHSRNGSEPIPIRRSAFARR